MPRTALCTRLLADISTRVYGADVSDLSESARWAEMIDTASFASAADAVRRDEPVLQLASVVEQHGDRAFLERVVPMLAARSVEDVARDRWVQDLFSPIAKLYETLAERVKARSRPDRPRRDDGFSGDAPMEIVPSAKFMSYALYPEAMYSVTLAREAALQARRRVQPVVRLADSPQHRDDLQAVLGAGAVTRWSAPPRSSSPTRPARVRPRRKSLASSANEPPAGCVFTCGQ